jgi:hypothetical protein
MRVALAAQRPVEQVVTVRLRQVCAVRLPLQAVQAVRVKAQTVQIHAMVALVVALVRLMGLVVSVLRPLETAPTLTAAGEEGLAVLEQLWSAQQAAVVVVLVRPLATSAAVQLSVAMALVSLLALRQQIRVARLDNNLL